MCMQHGSTRLLYKGKIKWEKDNDLNENKVFVHQDSSLKYIWKYMHNHKKIWNESPQYNATQSESSW